MAEAPPIPEPARTLAPSARWVWRANWAAAAIAGLVAGRMLARALPDGWDPLLWALPLAVLLVGAPLAPELHWRRWRWEVREHEIDLRRGVLELRRTLIPMERVQHVETTRGLMEQALGLATVAVHTAAGSHTIPLLTQLDADRLRARIAELARTGDEPEEPEPEEREEAPPAPEEPPAERPPPGDG